MKKVYFIDHYDSFSFNLIDWLAEALPAYELVRVVFDDDDAMGQLLETHAPLIISPGPKHPKDVQATLDLVAKKLGAVPIFGVCLGHQILCYLKGLDIVKSEMTFHGSSRRVQFLKSEGAFGSLEGFSNYASYNSLCAKSANNLSQIAAVNSMQEIEAIEFNDGVYPAIGVQFHPESFLSENKKDLQNIWKSLVDDFYSDLR